MLLYSGPIIDLIGLGKLPSSGSSGLIHFSSTCDDDVGDVHLTGVEISFLLASSFLLFRVPPPWGFSPSLKGQLENLASPMGLSEDPSLLLSHFMSIVSSSILSLVVE